jgi:twitching motility two-component system response regulator PilH
VSNKILIVDDSQATVRLIQDMLEQGGYSSVGLNDAARIEETIETERPSLILMDVVMPQRNGFQACRELKQNTRYKKIPLIFVTSKASASDRFWGEQQGADGHVAKPFTSEELLKAVRKFV